MRRLLLCGTAVLALTSGTALAGGMAEPVMEPEVVEAAASTSAAGIIVPILLLLLIAAAASGGSDAPTNGDSDIRLKTDIQWMGMQDGLSVYSWRYKSRSGVFQGVMAQEILASHPEAIRPRHDGMLTVDYARLPVPFRRLH